MKPWSCSSGLFKYLIRTIPIGTEQLKRLNIRLMSLMPSVLVALLSMTILRGRPFTSIATLCHARHAP